MRRTWMALGTTALLIGGLAGCGEDDSAAQDEIDETTPAEGSPETEGGEERSEPEGSSPDGEELEVGAVVVGDCFDDPTDMSERVEVEAVEAIPCEQPHDNEAYHLFDLPDGDHPGDDEIDAMALDGCLEPFESYVGMSYEESELEVFPLTPTEASWDEIDDREVICAVYLPEGEKLTGSVRDARR